MQHAQGTPASDIIIATANALLTSIADKHHSSLRDPPPHRSVLRYCSLGSTRTFARATYSLGLDKAIATLLADSVSRHNVGLLMLSMVKRICCEGFYGRLESD